MRRPQCGESGDDRRRWDLILVEDSSRFFRKETACGRLFETALDRDIRVIAINDDVDTAEEDWEDALHSAVGLHAASNRRASKRVKRGLEGLWRKGAAIGLLRPGYKRTPTRPATERDPAEGPFYVEIDPAWNGVVHEAFVRVHRNEPAWVVAHWLTEQGLPKCGNSTSNVWTDRNVIALIRRTIYRGLEEYRNTIIRKEGESGRHIAVRNDPDEVWTREMPHLRIVEDWLWYGANAAIDARCNHDSGAVGAEHPLAGIPRDSRGPLSGLFFCGICGSKMYLEGRAEGGYRCKESADGDCWNKATALKKIVHDNLSKFIRDRLVDSAAHLGSLVAILRKSILTDDSLDRQVEPIRKKIADLEKAKERLLRAIEHAGDEDEDTTKSLVERLRERDHELKVARAELDRVLEMKSRPSTVPDEAELAHCLQEAGNHLLDLDREAGALLRRLIPRIEAVPFRQFGSDKVVLRARFDLHLAKLLPTDLEGLLAGKEVGLNPVTVVNHRCQVDLFEMSTGPAHHEKALALAESGKGLTDIGRILDITKRKANIAVLYGRALRAAGQGAAFTELVDRPVQASRWRFRAS